MFSPHPGHHGRPRRAGLDEPAATPEKAAPVAALADSAPEWSPAPVPEPEPVTEAPAAEATGEQAPASPEPGSPADELAGVLTASEMPGTDDLRRLLAGLRGYNPRERGATMPNPVVRESRPQPAIREPGPAPVPGATVLLSFSRTGPTVVQPVDGLPERRTASGKPVIHLGDDPRSDGEAFAIGRMSDAYLDGLITVLMEERSARLKARNGTTGAQPSLPAPAFTPRREEGAA